MFLFCRTWISGRSHVVVFLLVLCQVYNLLRAEMFFCSVATRGTTVLRGTPWLFIPFCSPHAMALFQSVQSARAEKSLQPPCLFPWGAELPGSLSPHLISPEIIKADDFGCDSIDKLVADLCDSSYFTVYF